MVAGDEVLVEVGLEEARVGVLLHEGGDPLLGAVEGVERRVEDFLCGVGADLDVEVDFAR